MSDGSLFSPNWFRVAELRPQLGVQIRVRRQSGRDTRWYVFTDSSSGRQHRLNETAYQFAGRCNGNRTTADIWHSLLEKLGDQAPTQNELIALIGKLSAIGILQIDKTENLDILFQQTKQRSNRQFRSRLNPLNLRFSLLNPSQLLNRLDKVALTLFQPWMLAAWLLLVCMALIAAITHWHELSAHAGSHMLTPRYLLLSWLCFPLIKALHELAHGLAIRRWGGEVTDMGIALLVLVPAPYIDASAAAAFRSAYQRAMVSAAGIMLELAIAALALLLWLQVENGLLRDTVFVLAFIGSVSTLLFNGNPLLRFDGYYVVIDLLDLPNLAARSNHYWLYLIQRYLLKIPGAQSPEPARGERGWLVLYAPASWLYRFFVGLWISFWLASQSFWLGAAIGISLLYFTLIRPLLNAVGFVFFSPGLGAEKLRPRLIATATFVLVLLGLISIPLPYTTVAEAVIWPPEQAMLRAQTEGFVTDLSVPDGESVQAGQEIFTLEDPRLLTKQQQLQAKLGSLLGEQYQSFLNNSIKAQNLEHAMLGLKAEQTRIEERLSQLVVRAQISGRLVMPLQQDLPGKFVKQGQMLGYVFSPDQVRLWAVVDERDIALVRERTQAIRVRLADKPNTDVEAAMTRQTPAATQTLPSPALGDRAGGDRMTDPTDKDGVKTLEPVFLIELSLPANVSQRVGTRAWVHFEHSPEPLAKRWSRRIRQLFLKHFSDSR